jgi:hypothetical protein
MAAHMSVDVLAAEWSIEPSIGVKGDYNSNLLLSSFAHEAVYGHWISPGAKFSGSTERLEISGRVAADFVQYYGGQNINYTNMFFPLNARYKTESDVLGFDGGFTRDNTLMGELLQTGVALRFTQRNLWNANPTWTHDLTDTVAIQSSYQYLNASYQNGLRLGLADYVQQIGMTGIVYKPTERDQLQASGVYVNFHVPDVRLRAEIYGGFLSVTHMFSETLVGTVSGGPRFILSKNNSSGTTLSDNELTWVFSGSLEKKFEDFSMRMEAGRDINPSGFGLLLQTDRVAVVFTKQLTETLTATLSGQAFLAEGLATKANTAVFPQNRYVNVTPKVSWRISDSWSLDVSYTYAQRDVESASQTANANSTYVMITYYPTKSSLSR